MAEWCSGCYVLPTGAGRVGLLVRFCDGVIYFVAIPESPKIYLLLQNGLNAICHARLCDLVVLIPLAVDRHVLLFSDGGQSVPVVSHPEVGVSLSLRPHAIPSIYSSRTH